MMLDAITARRSTPTILKAAWCASAAFLSACSSGPPQPQKSPYEQAKVKIAPDAVMPMDRTEFRKTFAKLGRKDFDSANDLMEWAAIAAAESKSCDKVELVAVSDNATRKKIQWFVDCANKERFQITEDQALAARDKFDTKALPAAKQTAQRVAVAEPKSARWKNFNEVNAVSACDLIVQQVMLVPGSFNSAWKWDIEKDADSGIVTIQRDYKSENAYSMKINGRYHCEIDTGKAVIKTLKIREPDGWRKLI